MSGSQFGEQNLLNALQRYNNTVEQGSVDAGATVTSIPAQNTPGWETNQFTESLYFVEFLAGAVNAGLSRRITANTDDTLTTVAFPDAPAEDDEFVIRHEPKGATDATNLAEVGGTAQTGADWTPLLQTIGLVADAVVLAGATGTLSAKLRRLTTDLDALLTAAGATADVAVTDPALAASIVAALKGLLTDIGQVADAVVAAGATGSVSAKLRRLTADIGAILANFDTAISTLATEVTVATLATEATLASILADTTAILAQLDVALSTRAADATLTDGTQKAIARGAAKGATPAADVTSTNVDANTQAMDVSVKGTAAVSAAALPLPAGAATEATLATLATEATLGEVQDVPTQYTLLWRLKDLLTGIVLSAGSAIIGKVGIDQTTPGTTNAVAITGSYSTRAQIDISGSGDNTVIAAPGAGQRLVVTSLSVQNISATDTTAIFKSGATALDKYKFGERQGWSFVATRKETEWALAEDKALIINLDGANQHTGHVSYRTEEV